MPSIKKKGCFFDEAEAIQTEDSLRAMTEDANFNTESSYSSDSELYPDNIIPFVEKHMAYLRGRTGINPQQYVSNLRLMTRIR